MSPAIETCPPVNISTSPKRHPLGMLRLISASRACHYLQVSWDSAGKMLTGVKRIHCPRPRPHCVVVFSAGICHSYMLHADGVVGWCTGKEDQGTLFCLYVEEEKFDGEFTLCECVCPIEMCWAVVGGGC